MDSPAAEAAALLGFRPDFSDPPTADRAPPAPRGPSVRAALGRHVGAPRFTPVKGRALVFSIYYSNTNHQRPMFLASAYPSPNELG